ncbi:TetR/AcrR family transcriptional regulator [Cohnella suwonensis]|uniref:TetR/AcrR family transcriptional regulator n=1 Tax=Cohnella suwonensis TaxID=696072 RepID=A0ABW0LY17_9BACL
MTDKPDRRQVRTKQLLYDALMGLIEEKGVDSVNVTDIANRANLNRGTFYLHYRDVPDMLQQLKDDVFESVKSRFLKLDFQEAMAHADRNEIYPPSVRIFEELARHARFLRAMFGAMGDLSYAIRFRKLMTKQIFEKVDFLPNIENPPVPRDYVIAYMTSANFGMILHWLECGMDKTPEQMTRIMMKIVNYGPLVSFGLREAPPGSMK